MMFNEGKITNGILLEPLDGDDKKWVLSCVENDEVRGIVVVKRVVDVGNIKDDEPLFLLPLIKMIKLQIERINELNNNKGGQ